MEEPSPHQRVDGWRMPCVDKVAVRGNSLLRARLCLKTGRFFGPGDYSRAQDASRVGDAGGAACLRRSCSQVVSQNPKTCLQVVSKGYKNCLQVVSNGA